MMHIISHINYYTGIIIVYIGSIQHTLAQVIMELGMYPWTLIFTSDMGTAIPHTNGTKESKSTSAAAPADRIKKILKFTCV